MTIAPSNFYLVESEDRGLLLDLRSGLLCHLNASATLIWREYLAGQTHDQISESLASQYQLPIDRARSDTEAALHLRLAEMAAPSEMEFRYEETAGGYLFSRRGRAIFRVDEPGHEISLVETDWPAAQEIKNLLTGIAPKILSLRGATVLHAGAASVGGGALLFLGSSGAGKTTTARALVKAGASVVCEDKLVVDVGMGVAVGVVDTEAIVADWVAATAPELLRRGTATCELLARIRAGRKVPIAEIGFLSVDRRSTSPSAAERLSPSDAAGAIFSNSFLGSAAPATWKRHLGDSLNLASTVAAYRLNMPDGLPVLAERARQIVSRGSLRS